MLTKLGDIAMEIAARKMKKKYRRLTHVKERGFMSDFTSTIFRKWMKPISYFSTSEIQK
jgi:hypothetical protein